MRVNLILNLLLTFIITLTFLYTVFMYKQDDKGLNKHKITLIAGSIITITLALILWQTARL